jgi:hypothetical protein
MPPISVEKAGEIILKISALSTSLAQRPSIKLITIAKTEMHRVALTIRVTHNVSLSFTSICGFVSIGFLVIHKYPVCGFGIFPFGVALEPFFYSKSQTLCLAIALVFALPTQQLYWPHVAFLALPGQDHACLGILTLERLGIT